MLLFNHIILLFPIDLSRAWKFVSLEMTADAIHREDVTQALVTETLQLLKAEYWQKPILEPAPGSPEDITLKHQEYGADRRETLEWSLAVRILDSICTLMDSGIDGDIFAAALDLHGRITVVLAKNGLPSEEDRTAARMLFRTVAHAKDDVWAIFPFILNRCHRKISKSLSKLRDSLQELDLEELWQVDYQVQSLEDEFPNLVLLKEEGDYTTTELFRIKISRVVELILEQLVGVLDKQNEHTPFILENLHSVLCKIYQLSTTRIVQYEPEPLRRVKLPRRLFKVNRYLFAALTLQAQAHRLWSGGQKIRHRWVMKSIPDPRTRLTKMHLTPSRLLEPWALNITPSVSLKHQSWYPNAWTSWEHCILTRLHPEIRLVIHLDGFEALYNSAPDADFTAATDWRQLIPTSSRLRAIGCSKRVCYACSIWIRAYNSSLKTRWASSETNGRIFVDWALPGNACWYLRLKRVPKAPDDRFLEALEKELATLMSERGFEESRPDSKREVYVMSGS
ncbi:hypothetical protein D9758_005910 [Tetrapyrgos nigripes]|uniref:Uncharacterized protein n=1 Tax=Tetrapyrgos nigripes TaxID=182062 RepID=A0A8H5G2S9_9AGAR|nr:hypothetical protein D9758_005910 [Tetrapyrgos nigripes]